MFDFNSLWSDTWDLGGCGAASAATVLKQWFILISASIFHGINPRHGEYRLKIFSILAITRLERWIQMMWDRKILIWFNFLFDFGSFFVGIEWRQSGPGRIRCCLNLKSQVMRNSLQKSVSGARNNQPEPDSDSGSDSGQWNNLIPSLLFSFW